jgi:hypothetical protein
MRDRLARLLSEAEGLVNNDLPTVEQIADYLLANGVIVPPCKVGQTVWIRWGFPDTKKGIYPVKVYALRFDTKKNNMRLCVTGTFLITAYGGSFTHNYMGTFPWDSVGKTVFLTREEAEKALAERSGE